MSNPNIGKIWPAVLPAILAAGSFVTLTTSATVAAAQDTSQQQDASAQTTAASGERTDGQIEMDVVHTLDAAQELKQDWITAGTVQGEVTLSGTTASEQNRQLAESLAKKVSGVTKVVNDLKVGDPQTAQDQSQTGQDQDQGQYPDPAQNSAQNQPQDQPQGQYPNQGQYGDPSQQQAGNYPPAQPGYGQQPNYPQQGNPQQGNPQQGNPQQGNPQQGNPQQGYPQQPAYQGGQRVPYPAQGNYAQGNYPARPEQPLTPVTLPKDTLLKVRTSEPLDSKRAKDGTPVEFTVVRDVYAGGILAIPRGATVHGHVVDQKNAGAVGGSAQLGLKIESLDLSGHDYALDSAPVEVKGPNKAGRTAGNAFGGALLGAIIGGAVGGGEGAAIGAGAGAVGGTAATAATPSPRVWIPAEAIMDFHLNTPITVTPVSLEEAQRLAANAPPPSQRPTLYRRAPYPYGYYPPPPPPGYYRPY